MQVGFWATVGGVLFVFWQRVGRLFLIGLGIAFAFFVSVDSMFPEPEFTPFSFQDWVITGLRYVLPWALIVVGFLAIFMPGKRKPKPIIVKAVD